VVAFARTLTTGEVEQLASAADDVIAVNTKWLVTALS
jgi:hypothetical protein